MQRLVLAALLLLACAAPSLAQTDEPSPARLRAAEQLLDAMDMERTLERSVDAMLAQQKKQMPMMGEFEDIMREFMDRALDWSELRGEYVRLYASVYTEEELRQLAAFYQTPLGQRLMATLPELSARSMEISNARLQQYLPEMTQRMMERMMAADSAGKPTP